MSPGPVTPSVPVSPVPVVEGRHIIVEEISRTSAPARAEPGLGDHGIAFHQEAVGIDGGDGTREQVPDQPVERPEEAVISKLHLRDMPRLVNGQALLPGHRLGIIGVRKAVYIHTAWSPGDRGVGYAAEIVKNHGHLCPVQLSRSISACPGDRYPVFRKIPGIYRGQRVHPARINHPEMLGLQLRPSDPGRIVARSTELCLRPERQYKQGQA